MKQSDPSRTGAQFLHSKDSSLQFNPMVIHEQDRLKQAKQHGQDIQLANKPADQIADWLKILERTHGHNNPIVTSRIKEYYHKTYVIRPEAIPESTYQLEARIARQLGQLDLKNSRHRNLHLVIDS